MPITRAQALDTIKNTSVLVRDIECTDGRKLSLRQTNGKCFLLYQYALNDGFDIYYQEQNQEIPKVLAQFFLFATESKQ